MQHAKFVVMSEAKFGYIMLDKTLKKKTWQNLHLWSFCDSSVSWQRVKVGLMFLTTPPTFFAIFHFCKSTAGPLVHKANHTSERPILNDYFIEKRPTDIFFILKIWCGERRREESKAHGRSEEETGKKGEAGRSGAGGDGGGSWFAHHTVHTYILIKTANFKMMSLYHVSLFQSLTDIPPFFPPFFFM